jgi:hypothetical protein
MKQLNPGVIFLFACLAALLSPNVFAATTTVTNTNDSGVGSLRDAIAGASSGDVINFNFMSPATITASSTLRISTSLTISGPGASNLTISGAGAVQVFAIGSGVTAVISGVTIQNGFSLGFSLFDCGGAINNNGNLTVGNSTLSGNSAEVGAGVCNNGTLTVNNSTLSGNSSINERFSFGGLGIGIYNAYGGMVTVTNSTLSGNSAVRYGGGIYNVGGTLTITNSTLSGNSAGFYGGGVYNLGGTLAITNSTVSSNSAGFGGGVYNLSGILTVTNSTFSGNSAFDGGGVYNPAGTVTLVNSTLSGNSAIEAGGGIFNEGSVTVINCTLAANSAGYGDSISSIGSFTAKNSIFAKGAFGASGYNCILGPPFYSYGHNLSDDFTCAFSEIGDVNNTPAGLVYGLQDNGGPTLTLALAAATQAVDAIPSSPINYCTLVDGVTPVATDQRGVARPQGFGCDIGAYERKGFSSFTANLELKKGFSLNASFILSAFSAPNFDPLGQAVQLQVGPYKVTIPAGSFHEAQGSTPSNWAYSGSIGGVKLSVLIAPLGGVSYQLKAAGSPVDFSGVSNPVTVAIGVGFDTGSTQVTASF